LIKRLFPVRWAGIAAWTGAAIAWCVSIIGMQSASSAPSDAAAAADATEDPAAVATLTQQAAAMPALPESGLLIVRFSPQPPPPVPTQPVVAGGGGAARTFNPTPIAKVQSRGS
jgi:hypothetical protein